VEEVRDGSGMAGKAADLRVVEEVLVLFGEQ
jgi:hypothetical protein